MFLFVFDNVPQMRKLSPKQIRFLNSLDNATAEDYRNEKDGLTK